MITVYITIEAWKKTEDGVSLFDQRGFYADCLDAQQAEHFGQAKADYFFPSQEGWRHDISILVIGKASSTGSDEPPPRNIREEPLIIGLPNVEAPSRWSLADLFPDGDSAALEAAFARLEQSVTAFEALRPQLAGPLSAASLLDILQRFEQIQRQAQILSSYAHLRFAEDTRDQSAQTLLGRIEQFTADLANRMLFFELWWKALPEEQALPLLAGAGDYRYWLEALRHFRPHTLSEPEEKIVNLKNVTGASALVRLYDAITNRYTFKVEVEGELRELTRGELMVYVRHPDPSLRARAYQELYRVYAQDSDILAMIFQSLGRDWHNEQVSLRGFSSPIAARNLTNDIPDGVVDTLLDVCQRNAGIFQRFFQLKARRLGLERLRRYDIYAPLGRADKRYPYAEAAQLVFTSFLQFDPQLAIFAGRVFAENHLDSEVRKGKRSGAFCASTVPELTPWVLVNYQSRVEDVFTLAHELGHAIHSMLAAGHSQLTFQASLPLAETASTFGEMLLLDHLLAKESSAEVRRDLLFNQVDNAYATIQRQAFFALFERRAHEMVRQGASADDLAAAYLENLYTQFGQAVEVSDEFRWEWISIPHFYHVPFYVYAYSFGQLLVLALYQQYKQEPKAFKPRYRQILAAGGSKAPVQLLSEAGMDVYQPDFWQGGFNVLDELVRQLEEMP